jgi:hypothetical protein
MRSWLAAVALAFAAGAGHAADGCTVLLCLAGPWRSIPECVSPVRAALRDLAKGRGLPHCAMVSAGQGATSRIESASPDNCPPQYLHRSGVLPSGRVVYRCAYDGVIRVAMDGGAWSDIWWAADGRTVTNFSPAARQQLGAAAADTQFDDDYAAWRASGAAAAEDPIR